MVNRPAVRIGLFLSDLGKKIMISITLVYFKDFYKSWKLIWRQIKNILLKKDFEIPILIPSAQWLLSFFVFFSKIRLYVLVVGSFKQLDYQYLGLFR